jgi:phage regulator Rha-like protein
LITHPEHSLELVATKTEPRIDSRVLADQLGNTHRATIALVDRYLEHFHGFGQLTFKKAVGERDQGGGNALRFALLNEDQAMFLLSLSRNTDRVVELKARLVTAFATARRTAQQRQTEYLPEYHRIHEHIIALANGSENERFAHMNFNKLVNKVAGIDTGQRSTVPMAMLTAVQHVASLAMAGAADHTEGYARAKAALGTLQCLLNPPTKARHG